jgi:hypothetical protein
LIKDGRPIAASAGDGTEGSTSVKDQDWGADALIWVRGHWWLAAVLGLFVVAIVLAYRAWAYEPCRSCGAKTRYGDDDGALCPTCDSERKRKSAEERLEDEPLRACVTCATTMGKVLLPNKLVPGGWLIVDRCPDGHGVWLDADELDRVQGASYEDGYKEGFDDGASSGPGIGPGLALGIGMGVRS